MGQSASVVAGFVVLAGIGVFWFFSARAAFKYWGRESARNNRELGNLMESYGLTFDPRKGFWDNIKILEKFRATRGTKY